MAVAKPTIGNVSRSEKEEQEQIEEENWEIVDTVIDSQQKLIKNSIARLLDLLVKSHESLFAIDRAIAQGAEPFGKQDRLLILHDQISLLQMSLSVSNHVSALEHKSMLDLEKIGEMDGIETENEEEEDENGQ